MFEKSNHYLEYKIKKDSIQPIENDRGMPSTRAEGLSVNENTTHAQLYKIVTKKEEKSSTQNLINTDGLIYGFTYNNKIYLNPDIAKIEEITKINFHLFFITFLLSYLAHLHLQEATLQNKDLTYQAILRFYVPKV